jgi:hypothetical protein
MWRPHTGVQDAQAAVEQFLSGWTSGAQLCWLIFARDTGELVPSIAARKDENGVKLAIHRFFESGRYSYAQTRKSHGDQAKRICYDIFFAFYCARSRRLDVIHFVSCFLQNDFMSPNPLRYFLIVLLIALSVACACASDDPLFHSTDPLAPRDEWGVLHQTPTLYPTDFSSRYSHRFFYYLMSRHELLADPAYVGALQVCLRSRGYYCGAIDGIMSEEVSDAIARLQKNHAQSVTGRLTVPVRRALHLP